MSPRRLYVAVFLISAVGIAYELALMRIFCIAQWHHFAYMVISIAMLGFGASGTVLSLVKTRIRGKELMFLRLGAVFLALSLAGCYRLSQGVPFETFELVSQPVQLRHLLTLYLILLIPFFLVSTCIALAFLLNSRHVGRTYCASMVGSGIGAATLVGLLYGVHPQYLPYLLAVPVAFAYLLLGPMRGRSLASRLGVLVVVGAAVGLMFPGPITISQYKGLSYARQFPDAREIAEKTSALSVITALGSKQIRETPGQLSYSYPWDTLGPLPEQAGLYFDGGAVSAVNHFDGSLRRFAYLDYVTSAVAYRMVERPDTLVIGAGGGTDVLAALYHRAPHVTAVEVNPAVFRLLNENHELRDFYGALYERPDVTPVVADGRGYVASHQAHYDLIQIPLLDSFNAAAAGVHALNESYLYTVEALALYLERLTPRGVLAITRWLKTPPRDALKMFATAVEACERTGIEAPAQHLAFVRSWNTATIVVSKTALAPEQIKAVREFAVGCGFDLCYLPGIDADEVNRYTVLERPVYYEFARDVLSQDRERCYGDALFHLRPATDDRPYFFHFFKWASLPRLLEGMGSQWVPFVEWGYLTLAATLLQGALAGLVLIVLPLIVLARRPAVRRTKRWVVLYFAALGLAYMFLEIAFIQRLMLFLAYPVYAVAAVLTAFLVFSGLGGLFADYVHERGLRAVGLAVLAAACIALVYLGCLPALFRLGAGWPDGVKILVSVLVLAPLAFVMGLPFPIGLQRVANQDEILLPWAWGINGCASVAGAAFATLIAVHLGFRLLVLLALGLYGVAVLALSRMEQTRKPTPTHGPARM